MRSAPAGFKSLCRSFVYNSLLPPCSWNTHLAHDLRSRCSLPRIVSPRLSTASWLRDSRSQAGVHIFTWLLRMKMKPETERARSDFLSGVSAKTTVGWSPTPKSAIQSAEKRNAASTWVFYPVESSSTIVRKTSAKFEFLQTFTDVFVATSVIIQDNIPRSTNLYSSRTI